MSLWEERDGESVCVTENKDPAYGINKAPSSPTMNV